MNKTDFKPESPKTLEELVAWMRAEHRSHEQKPLDVEWRLLLLVKWLDVRLCEHERALLLAAGINPDHPKDCLCDDCYSKLTLQQQAALKVEWPR